MSTGDNRRPGLDLGAPAEDHGNSSTSTHSLPPGGPYQLLPALNPDDHAALREDIAAHGFRVPIDVDETGAVLDGHHRAAIAAELGLPCPSRVVAGLTEAGKRDHALSVNTARRHLTRAERRAVIAASVSADPELSDREHARRVGCSPTTVGVVRRELAGEVSKLDTGAGLTEAEARAELAATESMIDGNRQRIADAILCDLTATAAAGADLDARAAEWKRRTLLHSAGIDADVLAVTVPWQFELIDAARERVRDAVVVGR